MVLNYQTSQTSVSKFSNVLLKGTKLEFDIKSCQNSQNIHFFREKNDRIRYCSEFSNKGICKNTHT
jgi:hypothetical protein